jgi:quercetin dioxygenase-like cupin family protein
MGEYSRRDFSMHRSIRLFPVIIGMWMILTFAAITHGQVMAGMSTGRNAAEMKFTTIPPLPTCATASVQNGDPSKGASIIYARAQAGCTIPWHWHSPNEHLMIVSGVARVEMKDAKPVTLRSGGFAVMAGTHVHQFSCFTGPCQFYVYSDGTFDLHYVNKQGTEITPEEALKAVRERLPK